MDINQLKEKLIKENNQGLALDIDDTLSLTRSHVMNMLMELHGNPEGLTPEEIHEKYGWIHKVPYWNNQEILNWIEEQWNSNELQTEFAIIEDCHATLQQIASHVPIVAYITARPESVRRGTQAWLSMHSFPTAELVLRPHEEPDGTQWKAKVLVELYPAIHSIVDDNIDLITALPDDYQGTVYLFGQDSCPTRPFKVVCCRTWPDVLRAIQATHQSTA